MEMVELSLIMWMILFERSEPGKYTAWYELRDEKMNYFYNDRTKTAQSQEERCDFQIHNSRRQAETQGRRWEDVDAETFQVSVAESSLHRCERPVEHIYSVSARTYCYDGTARLVI